MNQITIPKKFEGARKLFEKMADDNFTESTTTRVGVLGHHLPRISMIRKAIAPFDKKGQISQGTVFHHQMDVRCCLVTVYESNNMWMIEPLENVDFRGKVIL